MNQEDGANVEDVREDVMDAVRSAFRPEFLNRLDEILLFKRLDRDHMTGIVDIQLQYLHDLLLDRQIDLQIDDKAKIWIADQGYDPAYGARPLKRVIQTHLQNKLAEMILAGEILDGARVEITEAKSQLKFSVSGKTSADIKSVA